MSQARQDERAWPSRRRTLGGLALGLTAALGATGRPARAQPAEAAGQPKGPWTRTGVLRRAGGVLHYATVGQVRGDRPPVVLLHKLGGWLADWRFVAERLAADRQIFAFDLPGHGDSRWLGEPPYIQTLGETASLLVGAMTELGLDRVDLVGTSLGGCASVPLAAFWPERVRKLALVSAALGGPRTLAQIAEGIDRAQTAMFDAQGDPVPIRPEEAVRVFGIVHPEQITVEGNASRRRAGRWIQPSERGVAVADILGTLKRIAAPTLLLYGDRDRAYIKYRPAAEAALHDVRTEFVAESGAFTLQDNPAGTAEALGGWLG